MGLAVRWLSDIVAFGGGSACHGRSARPSGHSNARARPGPLIEAPGGGVALY